MPAFGWFSSLQSGLPAVVPRLDAVLPLVSVAEVPAVEEPLAEALPFVADLPSAFESVEVEEGMAAEPFSWDCVARASLALLADVCAKAGAAARSAAATAALMWWDRIIRLSCR